MDNNFLVAIEKLALKCSSNEEVFGNIKNLFEIALQDERFIKLNEKKNFTDKKGNLKQYEKLDTSIKKLRNQTKTLKKEWKVITDRVKNWSGLAAGEEPEWYQHINPILAETNEEINPTCSALQTSFVNRDESDLESGSEDEEGIEEHDGEKLPLAALPQKKSNNPPKNWLLQYTKNDLKHVPTNKLYLNWQGLCRTWQNPKLRD